MLYDSEQYSGMKKKDFLGCPAVAYRSNGIGDNFELIDYIHGIDTMVIVRRNGEKIHITKVYNSEDDHYFTIGGVRYYLSTFLRI